MHMYIFQIISLKSFRSNDQGWCLYMSKLFLFGRPLPLRRMLRVCYILVCEVPIKLKIIASYLIHLSCDKIQIP